MTETQDELRIASSVWNLRYEVKPSDLLTIRKIVESTGFFHSYEVDIAVDLVEERLRRGNSSGYHFIIAENDSSAGGYVCYGEIACTSGSYDVYWIAVTKESQGCGLGRALMKLTEERIAASGGRRIYLETSGRTDYLPTRRFYERCSYDKAAELPDFYAENDSKVIYVKDIRKT